MTFQFHDFELDTSSYQLCRDGRPLKLEKMPMDLLFLLVKRAGELVPRHDIQQELWADAVFVDVEPAINTVIRKVRQALRDDADHPRFIETVVGKGYRFIAPVVVIEGAGSGDPQPRGRFVRLGIATVGLLLVLAAGIVLLITREARRASETPAAVTAIRSIAVLPLDNLSGDPTQDSFAEAMTDELITDLAKVSSLKVISRGSTVQFKGTHKGPPEIGRTLHVDALVEGSVIRSGKHVRVTAQLIDVATDRHLWAESYDRDLGDVLTLQKQVAGVIASAIRVTLTPGERAELATLQPTNPDAYLAYIEGRYHWNQRTEAALNSGIESFKAALAVDPSYAEAYAGIADCYTALGYGSYLPPKIAFENARASAQQSIALNPNIADAHASLAYVKLYYDWDFAGAQEEFQRAILLNPNSVTAHDWYSVYLTAMERFDEAQKEIARAQELDPLAAAINTDAGFVSYYSGHYDAAAKQLRATIEMSPGFPLAHLWLGRTYQAQEHYDDANREYAAAAVVVGDWPVTMAAIGNVEGVSGNRPAAEEVLNHLLALSRHKYVTPYGLGLVYAAIGDDARAFAALRQAVADRSNWLVWLKLDPRWGKLRRDPRFGELLQQLHFAQQASEAAPSLPPALAAGHVKPAALAHALTESLPLLRRHGVPPIAHAIGEAIGHAAADVRSAGAMPSKSAEEDPAEQQNSQRLPEGNLANAEDRRQQPVPQLQDDFAADGDEHHHPQERQRRDEDPFPSHRRSLMLSSIRRRCSAVASADAAPHSVCGRAACSRSRRSRPPSRGSCGLPTRAR